ncbi:hypothetical protein SASPL_101547 [Salvia splendens]|uniref:non-specific serine/threonine protein kinase n=1 Tax=Salvia splendens TaxID=180675 RepID=A0A8X8YRW9_SALSN|nr:hypothetical protein SASPL_101547 [Salvia splendens]
MISIATHCNVIRARGFCITQKRKLLVYPHMVNGSVAFWLRERNDSLPPIGWLTRMKIALGAAKGLAYLHHDCPRKIIHCSVKASNIFLDGNFEAVLADLSLGEFVDCCGNDIVTPVKGRIGHIAPEYLATGKCSMKNDVFAYGVFLLELITAQRGFDLARLANGDDMMLIDWVKHIYKEREWKVIVDAELQGKITDEEVEELLQIALICTRDDPEERPTMLEVARRLEVTYHLAKGEAEWSMEDFNVDILEGRDVENSSLDKLHAATEGFSNKIIKVQLLVFPLMVNGSVDSWLTGRHESQPPLTWKQRKNIAIGAARGLAHLHDKCGKKIIHCDVKAANILLDDNFESVVADFKSANYGAFLLELITGRRIINLIHVADENDRMCVGLERRWESLADNEGGDDFMEAAGESRCLLHKIQPRQTSKDGGCRDDVRISLGCGSEFRRAVRNKKRMVVLLVRHQKN